MKVKSFLPCFNGFYSTLFEPNYEQAFESAEENEGRELTEAEIEFDYSDYMNRVAERCCHEIQHYLNADGLAINIEFEGVHSPREYNFTNDSINCEYTLTDECFDKLIDYCKTNLEAFTTYLKEKYSSRSGFISFFQTDVDTWFNEYLTQDSSDFEHCFGSVLEFYLENEGFTDEDLYYAVVDEMYLDYKIVE